MTEPANINEAAPLTLAKNGFGRIFETMYQGSMVGAGPNVFALWPYVIAHMRGHSEYGALVELNPVLLGFIFGTKESDVEAAIDYLCSPDPKSRTPTEDGRRLVKMGQFLYRVVNGACYLALRKKEDARFSHAVRQSRYEAKRKIHKTKAQIRAANEAREKRFVDAVNNGDESSADRIAAEGLPSGGAANGNL
jgi:hypothetical protein